MKKVFHCLFFVVLLSISLTIFNSWIIPNLKNLFVGLRTPDTISWASLEIIPAIIAGYFLISFSILSLISVFKKVKSFEDGSSFIYKLVILFLVFICGGLIGGVFLAIIVGFMVGYYSGIIFDLSISMLCLIVAVLVSLGIGLIVEIIYGLQEEMKKSSSTELKVST